METVKVYSPILDKDIRKNINNSPIWKEAYHESEISNIKKPLTEYTFKFEGLKPIQLTKMKKHKKS